ncbi:ATP-binding cassette domain-containing protein [Candidatus Woesearchaeota archaeon]|nr:ATP-binding cassette domain-containing protein [Candidatus Woesearchaeota archaeon]
MQKKSSKVEIKNLGIKFKFHNKTSTKKSTFFALRNINITANSGDVIGIIGKNGAGKTTLLRAIAGIYIPDEGSINVEGHPFLMDLKSGFNREIDGISNIFLVCAMNKQTTNQTKKKLTSIVNFSGIKKFIHEPINNYSSGMIARLAFAIGINIDYDILLIDETLSVGDNEFKNKCLEEIKKITKNKEKIVFIASHDEKIINTFCTKKIEI